jgi:hypothetical protein
MVKATLPVRLDIVIKSRKSTTIPFSFDCRHCPSTQTETLRNIKDRRHVRPSSSVPTKKASRWRILQRLNASFLADHGQNLLQRLNYDRAIAALEESN